MASVEQHRQGLLEHARNLEHLLNEASKHTAHLEELLRNKEIDISKFIQHLGNLDHLLSEKDKDLQQTKLKMEEYAARCYRYEQRLQEYGEIL